MSDLLGFLLIASYIVCSVPAFDYITKLYDGLFTHRNRAFTVRDLIVALIFLPITLFCIAISLAFNIIAIVVITGIDLLQKPNYGFLNKVLWRPKAARRENR